MGWGTSGGHPEKFRRQGMREGVRRRIAARKGIFGWKRLKCVCRMRARATNNGLKPKVRGLPGGRRNGIPEARTRRSKARENGAEEGMVPADGGPSAEGRQLGWQLGC